MTREIDRTAIITFQACPRQRWLSREIPIVDETGKVRRGLQRKRKNLALQFGSAFHNGAELLLAGDVEGAVIAAHTFLTEQFEAQAVGFDGETPTDIVKAMEYGREEQMALAEALIRGWAEWEMDSFLDQFEVIEVEKEGRATLSQAAGPDFICGSCGKSREEHYDKDLACVWNPKLPPQSPELVLLFRPDALVREKSSGDLFVVSWKTCATFGKRNVDQSRHDMQSMSEVWGVESSWGTNRDVCVEGVLYKWIVKGRRSLDDWDGTYKQDSPLIYAWKKLGQSEEDTEWSWKYSWTDPDEINPKTGNPVGHKLGKGWKKVPVWREYPGGVNQWIADLASQSVNPRHLNALEATFPQATPVERRADEVDSWRRQVIAQETRVATSVNRLDTWPKNATKVWSELLDDEFPQFTHSCHSYSGCPFIPICWEGVAAEPGELYQIRTANHPESGGDDE